MKLEVCFEFDKPNKYGTTYPLACKHLFEDKEFGLQTENTGIFARIPKMIGKAKIKVEGTKMIADINLLDKDLERKIEELSGMKVGFSAYYNKDVGIVNSLSVGYAYLMQDE